jgi:hypothetical protein
MRRKTFSISAGPRARQLLAEVITTFAEAAYPPGASDCAQVARETLLTTAAQIRQADGPTPVSVRQRSMLKQAVKWYFGEVSPQARGAHEQPLLDLLAGQSVDDSRLG